MTPAQQSALEELAGRPLTAGEFALAAIRNDAGLAESLSGRVVVVSRAIGRGTILSVMAPLGGMFLAALRQIGATQPPTVDTANVAEVVGLIDRADFDIGEPVARTQLQVFAEANPDFSAGISALLALAEEKAVIAPDVVSAILNIEGA